MVTSFAFGALYKVMVWGGWRNLRLRKWCSLIFLNTVAPDMLLLCWLGLIARCCLCLHVVTGVSSFDVWFEPCVDLAGVTLWALAVWLIW